MTPIRASLLVSSLAAVGVAQAQTAAAPAPTPAPAPAPAPPKADSSLTWNGITLYGIVDVGLQYQTHGVPISDYFPAGSESIISKNSNHSITGITPNNLSQSRIGLSGLEPLGSTDVSFVFRLETFFNPHSGNLSDALKSQVLNNGKPLAEQGTTVDSSVAGQLFAGAAYAGFSSASLGSLTFGRHVTPLADGIAKYDPMGAAQAFSVIGFSGTAAGGGDTENRRLDQSVKYTGKFGFVHIGALYQFNGSNGAGNTAAQFQLGGELAGASVDAYYAKKKGAIATSSLSATQVNQLSGVPQTDPVTGNPIPVCTATPAAGSKAPPCVSVDNALAATISDNTTYSIMGLYNFGAVKIYAGYENIKFENPDTPIEPGFITIGGYQLAFTSNTAYTSNKTLEVVWAGAKWAITPEFEVTGSYYGYRQKAFATGANAGCDTSANAACKGQLNAFSLLADYKFSKRFDGYLGTMWSGVEDGLANGYLLKSPTGNSAATITTTLGMRFKF